jgi:sigma-B regulation protein RsbU (phosphoserine phosphatase)
MIPHLLLAEDDPATRLVTHRTLRSWGYDPVVVTDGEAAIETLEVLEGPCVAVLDWMMPLVDGVEVVRRIRAEQPDALRYLILLTSRQTKEDVVEGLEAGADDYVGKPFHPAELRARIKNGIRLLETQAALSTRVRQLEQAMAHVQQLQELLPICTYCKRVRSDENYWTQVESYLGEHLDVQFSHGICPSCYEKIVEPELETLAAMPPVEDSDGEGDEGETIGIPDRDEP